MGGVNTDVGNTTKNIDLNVTYENTEKREEYILIGIVHFLSAFRPCKMVERISGIRSLLLS